MKQLKAYKFRIYPSEEQKIFFSKTFGCVRLVYNLMLNDRIKAYEESKGNPDKKLKYPTPAKYKKEYEFLKEVDSLALANAQMNLDKAYKNFFRDKSIGFPKFKSKKNPVQSYTTNNQNGTINICENWLKLPKLKELVKIREHRKREGIIKSATISRNGSGKYFISLLCETDIQELTKTNSSVQSYTTNNQNGTINIFENWLKLPKLKELVKIREHRKIEGIIKSATISRNGSGKYFISLLCEVNIQELPKTNSSVGIDLGIKDMAILSTGEKIKNLKFSKQLEDKLKREQRKLSKKFLVAKKLKNYLKNF